MREFKQRLTEEQYKRMLNEPLGVKNAILESEVLPDDILMGYGFYGCIGVYDGEPPYALIRIGDSCD